MARKKNIIVYCNNNTELANLFKVAKGLGWSYFGMDPVEYEPLAEARDIVGDSYVTFNFNTGDITSVRNTTRSNYTLYPNLSIDDLAFVDEPTVINIAIDSGDYIAEVSKDKITVGCQEISYKTAVKIWEAIESLQS